MKYFIRQPQRYYRFYMRIYATVSEFLGFFSFLSILGSIHSHAKVWSREIYFLNFFDNSRSQSTVWIVWSCTEDSPLERDLFLCPQVLWLLCSPTTCSTFTFIISLQMIRISHLLHLVTSRLFRKFSEPREISIEEENKWRWRKREITLFLK